ncbi:MAG: alternative ribosome rescue aminoacyl-tRNA hydrolase ArfB [Bdellovibrionota bacterium]
MIFVLPSIVIPDSELEFSFTRSSGPGGQNVNKVNSKAVLRWKFSASEIPLGVKLRFQGSYGNRLTKDGDFLLTSDRFRDQGRNLADCQEKLREMLLAVALPPKPRKKTKPTRSSKERRHTTKRNQGEKKRNRQGGSWD